MQTLGKAARRKPLRHGAPAWHRIGSEATRGDTTSSRSLLRMRSALSARTCIDRRNESAESRFATSSLCFEFCGSARALRQLLCLARYLCNAIFQVQRGLPLIKTREARVCGSTFDFGRVSISPTAAATHTCRTCRDNTLLLLRPVLFVHSHSSRRSDFEKFFLRSKSDTRVRAINSNASSAGACVIHDDRRRPIPPARDYVSINDAAQPIRVVHTTGAGKREISGFIARLVAKADRSNSYDSFRLFLS